MKVAHVENYVTLRKKEYPPIEEQLDAIMKGGQDFAQMQQQIAAIKAKYPKPNEAN